MDGMRFVVVATYDGNLSSNKAGSVLMACNATLEKVTVVTGDPGDATLRLGDRNESSGFMTTTALTDSNAGGLTFGRGDLDGTLVAEGALPRLTVGQIFDWTLDYDGASGLAAEDVTLAFWFLEG